MISFARYYEDVLLERVFRKQPAGFYIDVGAGDPILASSTCWFYLKGWRGINIEPLPELFRRLERARTGDVNLQVAVAEQEMTATLHVLRVAPDQPAELSTLAPEMAQPHVEMGYRVFPYEAPVRTLAGICAEHARGQQIDFLCINAGGAEEGVIRGHNWRDFRPRVCVVAARHPVSEMALHQSWEPLLLDNGYVYVYFDGSSRFYVDARTSGLARYFETRPGEADHFVRFSARKGTAGIKAQVSADDQRHLERLARMQESLEESPASGSRLPGLRQWQEDMWLRSKLALLQATGGRFIPNGAAHLRNSRRMFYHRRTMQRLAVRYDFEETIVSHALLYDDYRLLSRRFAARDIVIDVGAHIGGISYLCYLLGSRNIFAYEADASTFTQLQKNLQGLKGIHLHHTAVFRSDLPPDYTLQHSGGRHDNTGAATVITGGELFDHAGQEIVCKPSDAVREVSVMPLDEILARFERVKFLKLDCEGSEFPILLTSKQLHKVDYIAGEIHEVGAAAMDHLDPHARVEGFPAYTAQVLVARLADCGFEVATTSHANSHLSLFWASRRS